jgi:hypothetical protein
VRFVRSIIESVKNDRRVVVRLVGATQDITEAKRAQDELWAGKSWKALVRWLPVLLTTSTIFSAAYWRKQIWR